MTEWLPEYDYNYDPPASEVLEEFELTHPQTHTGLCGVDCNPCDHQSLSIYKHWTYTTYSDGRPTENKIDRAYIDGPLCPPDYDKITPLMFYKDLKRKAPRDHLKNLVAIPVNVDRFGMELSIFSITLIH